MIPWGIMGMLLFILFYLIHDRMQKKNVWTTLANKYRNRVDEKLGAESAFVAEYGSIENKSLFYKLDRLILTSGVRNHISWLSGEVFLFLLVILTVAGFIEGIFFTGNGFIALFIAALQFVGLYVVVLALSGRTYNQIEDGTSLFVSILSNHAKGSADIVTIMQNTLSSVDGPII